MNCSWKTTDLEPRSRRRCMERTAVHNDSEILGYFHRLQTSRIHDPLWLLTGAMTIFEIGIQQVLPTEYV